MVQHLNIKVYGQVQGVFFRYYTKEKAESLSLSGFVKNMPGGTVYLETEGEEESLKKLIEWCRKGPELAEVEKIEVKEGVLKNFSGFEIY